MERKEKIKIAFFDLDKTILKKDSTIYFIPYFLKRRPLKFLRAISLAPFVLFYILGIVPTEIVKRAYASLFTGLKESELNDIGEGFVKEVLLKRKDELFFKGALKEIERLKSEGYFLVISSASFEFYVSPLGRELGFNSVEGSRLWRHGDKITGKLYGLNNRGAEKKKRIWVRDYFSKLDYDNSRSYSDSISDLPLLNLSGCPVCVNPDKKLLQMAQEKGWEIRHAEDWV